MLNRAKVLKNDSSTDLNGFDFEELPNIPKINLRGNYNDKNFITNAEKALNAVLPNKANTSNVNGNLRIIWLSPDEWLIEIYEIKYFKKIYLDLEKLLNNENTSITDVTDSRTILKLSGNYLYKLLSKFMIIDLDKALKNKFSVAQTIFIKVPILIIRNHDDGEKQSINLYANRSHAQYINNLLTDGSKNINF